MPAVLEYVAPTSANRNDFNSQVSKERQTRRTNYINALRYYEGKHPEQLDFDPRKGDEVNDNVNINLVKMSCERTVSFLFPESPMIQTDPVSIEDTEEEKWLRDFFEDNGGLHMFTKLGTRGFLAGHSFVKVAPNKVKGKKPTISVLDPLTITIYWDAENVEDIVWYEQRILVGSTVHIYDYVRNPSNDTWMIYHYQSLENSMTELEKIVETLATKLYQNYQTAIDKLEFGSSFALVDHTPFPDVGLPPIIEIPHLPHPSDRYGLEEFNQKDLQDTINLIASLRNQIAREAGVPVDVIIGADPDEVQLVDDIWVVPPPQAKVQRMELKGDIVGVTSMLEKLIETYLAIARVVILKGEAKDLQRVTNASVRTLFLDQIAKNNILQASYGRGLKQIALLGLRMSGLPSANKDFEIQVHFPNPLPTDYTELANINAILANIGARSKRTISTSMGDNWAFEKEVMADEQQEDLERQRAQMELMQEFQPKETEDDSSNSDTPLDK